MRWAQPRTKKIAAISTPTATIPLRNTTAGKRNQALHCGAIDSHESAVGELAAVSDEIQ